MDFSTPHNAYHSTRVLCDQMGLSLEHCVEVDGVMYQPKDIICATIWGESEFDNTSKNINRNSKGVTTSTDWGICQINDYFHIGTDKDFPSVQYVLDNPDKCVAWMIERYKEGHIDWWCAHASGWYKHFLGKSL